MNAANEDGAIDEAEGRVPLASVLCVERLARRSRPPDYETESRLLATLVQGLADAPHAVFQTTAEQILEVFRCGSVGFSLLTDDGKRFYWPAIAGQWQPHIGGGTPRDFGPCGDVLERSSPLLFSRWERRYPYLLATTPPAEEALVVPVYVAGKAVGTIWAIAHDDRRTFDGEDLRLLESVARFAAAAYRVAKRADPRQERRAALNLMEDAVQARRATDVINAQLRASEAALADELAAARALQAVSTRMFQQDGVEALYAQIVDSAAVIMRADMASMQVVDEQDDALRMLAFRGFEPAFGEIFALDRADGRASWSVARRDARRVVVADVDTCDFLAGSAELEQHRKMGIRAVQSTPLVSRSGVVLGVISTHWRQPHEPSERALHLLDALARQAADALERAEAEEELRESEANYRAIFNGAGVALWDKDFSAVHVAIETLRSEGVSDFRRYFEEDLAEDALGLVRVTDVNDECVKMFEARDKDELLALWRKTFAPESLPTFVDELVAVAEGRMLPQREVRRQTLRGKPIDLLFTMTLPLGAKQLDRVLFSGLDITERRVLERQALEHTHALIDLDRRKDEFLAMLSHELRNPLAPITNAAQMLRFHSATATPVERHAQAIIERQSARLKRLVDELLEVSRMTTGKLQLRRERVTLQGVVEGAVETTRPFIEQGRHEISVSVPAEPVWLDADAARLEQVVVNLLTNAAKFTEQGGRIGVTLEREGDVATLRVRDSGIGIAPELLPRIFDLFTQAERTLDRAQGGLGIGLSLVQRVVQLHGGTVEASSAVGEGSEFVVRLPVTGLPSSEVHSLPEQLVGAARRVLVVDDNTDAADTLAMLLNATRHDARPVYESRKVLAAMRDYHPHVVLLDIGMPELNGYELAARIRGEPALSGIVLVAVTGYGQDADRRRSEQAGFDHHLVKPVDLPALERILASA